MYFRFTRDDLFLLLGILAIVAFVLTLFVLGVHALVHGQMPGRWLQRVVRQPRLAAAGMLIVLVALALGSWWLLVVAVALVVLGFLLKRSV